MSSNVADKIISFKIKSVLDGLNSSLRIVFKFSNKSSSLSMVPKTVSLINFLYLCFGKINSKNDYIIFEQQLFLDSYLVAFQTLFGFLIFRTFMTAIAASFPLSNLLRP